MPRYRVNKDVGPIAAGTEVLIITEECASGTTGVREAIAANPDLEVISPHSGGMMVFCERSSLEIIEENKNEKVYRRSGYLRRYVNR
jgi:hypothetical protein